jgi:hypothetical protein
MNIEHAELISDREKALIESIITTVRGHMADGEEVDLTGYMAGEKGVAVVPLGHAPSKDIAMLGFRHACKVFGAEVAVLVMEAWAKEVIGTPEEAKAIRAQYKDVESMPGRMDVISIQVETHAGAWMAQGVTTPHDGKPREMTEPEFKFMDGVEGRMTGFLPPRTTAH